jgi:hypothetical protein
MFAALMTAKEHAESVPVRHEQVFSDAGLSKLDFAERDNADRFF